MTSTASHMGTVTPLISNRQKKKQAQVQLLQMPPPLEVGSPRSTPEELQMQREAHPRVPPVKLISGHPPSGSALPRRPIFSSNVEEPIVMSRMALAAVLRDVHFSEEDDEELLPVALKSPSFVPKPAQPSLDLIAMIGRCDTSYSTSSLIRHALNDSFPLVQILAWIVKDYFQLALKSPLRSAFIFQRILQLLWNGQTKSYRLQLSNNYSTQRQPMVHLQPSIQGIRNYGQTCFLNAVLQSLASLDSLLAYSEWIANQQEEQQEQKLLDYHNTRRRQRNRIHKPTKTTTVSELLLPLLQSLNGQKEIKEPLDPRDLLWRIAQKNPQFQTNRHLFGWSSSASGLSATGEQQDAQELLQALLEMMIVDANLDDSYTPPQQHWGLSDYFKEEKKDDNDNHKMVMMMDDEVLTVLSDRWSPRNSSNNSLCSSVDETEMKMGWSHVQMIDQNGTVASYEEAEKDAGLPSSILSSSLESSFLSTTSTMVTSPAREHRQQQPQHHPSSNLSASMQIMLSTISSITKTPLSCWTGSLVQCQRCHHNKAVRNQEWRDIPIVPTALSTAPIKLSGPLPPCTLQDCLRNFTQVERVADVECGNCTLQNEIRHWKEEAEMLRGAVECMERRQPKNSSNLQPPPEALGLRQELEETELKLWRLQQQDPDDYDPKDGQIKQMLRSDALKCLVLTRLPSVLCLHVQRRYYDPMTNRMAKIMQHVVFEELLDLAPYCAYGGGNANAQRFLAVGTKSPHTTKPIWYRLTSVIVHQGNAFGGHYVCYRRLPARLSSSHQWHYCSDNVVQPVNWDQVQRAQAYMLFYEAI